MVLASTRWEQVNLVRNGLRQVTIIYFGHTGFTRLLSDGQESLEFLDSLLGRNVVLGQLVNFSEAVDHGRVVATTQ